MKPLRFMPLIVGLILALAPGAAQAQDGTIQNLTFDPDPATEGQTVAITVLGTGKCKKVSINFGDISPPVVLDNLDFDNNNTDDNSTSHVYVAAGTYTVTAAPVQQCDPSGGAQKSLIVGEGGGIEAAPDTERYLCDILKNCGRPMAAASTERNLAVLQPHLGGVFPFSVIEPGGDVIVTGQNFGRNKGELHIFLKTDQKDVKLDVDVWDNNGIGGRIPNTTIGVVDQPAEFYVVNSSGDESNRSAPVSFTAKRMVRILPRSDAAFDDCSCEATCNTCAAAIQRANCPHDCFTSVDENGTLSGFHYAACGIGTDSDFDTFDITANFKNGWEMDHATIINQVPPGEGNATVSLNKASKKVKVNWSVTQCDTLIYTVYVFIKGPMATDFK